MNASGLRIVHVFRAPLGGLFRHVIDLAGEQAVRGHQIGLFFDAGAKDARVEAALAALPGGLALGVGLAPISRHPGPGDLSAFLQFRRWLAEARPDVVHGHGAKGGLYARLAVALHRGENRPISVYTPHGGSFNYLVGSFAHSAYMQAERALARTTDLFLFESDYIAARFHEAVPHPKGLVLRAYNGLSEGEFAAIPLDEDAAQLLYIGELREAKGVDTLIDALAELKRRGRPGLRLAGVGSGPDRGAFERHVERVGLAGAVRFHGPLPARRAFALGDVLIVPSRRESLPYIVLEAAAAMKPIVATKVGGIPEIFGPYAGRLIAPDEVGALADAIAGALDESAETRARASQGLQAYVANRFSVSAMADAALGAYAQARQRRGAARPDARARLRPLA